MKKTNLTKNNKLNCWSCKKKFQYGYKLEFSNGWFRGDDEIVLECKECYIDKFKRNLNYNSDMRVLAKYRPEPKRDSKKSE